MEIMKEVWDGALQTTNPMYLDGVGLFSYFVLSISSSFIQERQFSQKTVHQLESHRKPMAIEESCFFLSDVGKATGRCLIPGVAAGGSP